MKPSEAIDLFQKLTAAFPSAKLTPDTAQLYSEYLTGCDAEVGSVGVAAAMVEFKFFPSYGELVHCCERASGMGLAVIPDWDSVQRAFGAVGHYGTPTFDDPITEIVVAAMGWRNLCLSTTPMADRAHFMKLYTQYADDANAKGRIAGLLDEARAGRGLLGEYAAGQRQLNAVGDADE